MDREQMIVNALAFVAIAGLIYLAMRKEEPKTPVQAAQRSPAPKAFKHDDDGVILKKRENAVDLIEIGPSGRARRVRP
jgi:hypothetical protein